MEKQMIFKEKTQTSIQKGVNAVADIVKITLGPKGKNVLLDQKYLPPLITNDGVTIAREVKLNDPFENMGAEIIKEVCIKTNEEAGDGTTTAIVLSQSLLNEAYKNLAAGCNAIYLNNGIKKACNECIKILKQNSSKISSDIELEQIASVSAGRAELGKIIAEAVKKVGKEGVITIEENSTSSTEIKVQEGMQIDRGYMSPYMSTDLEKMEVIYENALVLIVDDKPTFTELLPILEQIAGSGQKLLLIADDLDTETLSALVINKMRGNFACATVKSPAYGEKKQAILGDIASLCGTKVYSSQKGDDIKQIVLEDLGKVKKAKITKDETTLIGTGTSFLITKRIEKLKEELASCQNEYDKDFLKNRLAKLSGGVAVIYVGAQTEIELKEKKLRMEDALNATMSALQEGVVTGGGTALLKCQKPLKKLINSLKGEEKLGAEILYKTLEAPLRQIVKNCGLDDGIILEKVKNSKKQNFGFDAMQNKFCNMIECGIIDPAKVTIAALNSACSVVSTLITSEGMICNINIAGQNVNQ